MEIIILTIFILAMLISLLIMAKTKRIVLGYLITVIMGDILFVVFDYIKSAQFTLWSLPALYFITILLIGASLTAHIIWKFYELFHENEKLNK